jgi:hypothetical protein
MSGVQAQAAQEPARSGMSPIANEGVIEDGAIDALKEMSAYLMTAKTLGITSQGSLDVVTNDGQRIQLDGTTTYKIRKPGFVIDYDSDIKSRRFIYDGKTFTVYSPKLGFYATAPAPAPTRKCWTRSTASSASRFRWRICSAGATAAMPTGLQALKSAYEVGSRDHRRRGTDHFAFREDDVDWEVWIQQGDQPLPRKLVIVDRTDPSRPTFTPALLADESNLHRCGLHLRPRRECEADPAGHLQGRVRCAAKCIRWRCSARSWA